MGLECLSPEALTTALEGQALRGPPHSQGNSLQVNYLPRAAQPVGPGPACLWGPCSADWAVGCILTLTRVISTCSSPQVRGDRGDLTNLGHTMTFQEPCLPTEAALLPSGTGTVAHLSAWPQGRSSRRASGGWLVCPRAPGLPAATQQGSTADGAGAGLTPDSLGLGHPP